MNIALLSGFFLLGFTPPIKQTPPAVVTTSTYTPAAQQLSIISPKANQKVRGDIKIYGKAAPGSVVKLTVSSVYFKTKHDNQERISKGEGPVKRMNRKFTITTDRNGTWMLKSIELINAGWEETFTITAASAGQKTVSVEVVDRTRPMNID